LTGTLTPPPPGIATAQSQSAAVHAGFFTFYDGSNVIAEIPLTNDQAQFTNVFAGGSHQFSAVYSGDSANASSNAGQTVSVIAPADGVFYNSFEVPPGT